MSIFRIESKQNIKYKALLKSQQDKQTIFFEGVHLCEAGIQSGLLFHAVWMSDTFVLSNTSESKWMIDTFVSKGVSLYQVPDNLFKRLTQTPSPQGIVGVLDVSVFKPKDLSLNGNALLLDRVQDPGNIGTLLRTAVAVGFKTVYLSKGCANPFSNKVLRSAQGAHFHLDIHIDCDLDALLSKTQVISYGAVLSETAKSLYHLDLSSDMWLLLGHEGQGISSELLDLVDEHVIIPQSPLVESLNVGVAGSVILFEKLRQSL
ncbi:MAG: RNA methyltransferase [Alcaligenaceae bacterium]|nr:RNA methyltransferase [Alcaligenaceae bacterium]